MGLCCTRDGGMIVADNGNHRIQIFDCKGKHLRMFGSEGNANNQFGYPFDVCIDNHGQIIVADYENNRIRMWNGDGSQVIGTFYVGGCSTRSLC